MTAPTQSEIRSWARSQGLSVNARGSLPAAVVQAYAAANGAEAPAPARSGAGADQPSTPGDSVDLARALRDYLAELDAEVAAVTSLSERIDVLVTQLNAARAEQAARLTVLDDLQASVDDPSLGAFLTQAIRPRGPQVPEVVPDRLSR